MDGVMQFYTDSRDTEQATAASSAGRRGPTAGLRDVITAGGCASADSNTSLVSDVQYRYAVATPTPQMNGNVDDAVRSGSGERISTSSSESSEVTECLEHIASSTTTSSVMTTAESRFDDQKAWLSDSSQQLLHSRSHVEVTSSVDSESEAHLCDLPDTRSSSQPVMSSNETPSQASLSSQTSPETVSGQSIMSPVTSPVNVVESQSIAAKENVNTDLATITDTPSSSSLDALGRLCAADVAVKEDVTSKADCDVSCQQDSSSSVCRVPAVSLSCSSMVHRLRSYIPSPGPLTQMYGGSVSVTTSDSESQTLTPPTSSAVTWNSLLVHSPLRVGGDVSEITAKISAARSCSLNTAVRPLTVNEDFLRQRTTESFRGFRSADSRSTPWLAASERSAESLRSPSLVLGLAHSSSVSGTLSDSCSVGLSLSSSVSMTPLPSRSSSLASNDSSTLQTSTLIPDCSRKFSLHFCCSL